MTEAVPPHPLDEMDALAWLRSQPDGRVTANAAELGRQWGWNRMRTGRRLKAGEKAGLIYRNAEAIIATSSVTSTITDVAPTVADAVSVTLMQTAVTRRFKTLVRLAALIAALSLACVSAAFSIDGLTAILPALFGPLLPWELHWKLASSSSVMVTFVAEFFLTEPRAHA